MKINRIATLCVTCIVVLILTLTILVPIIDTTSERQITVTNEVTDKRFDQVDSFTADTGAINGESITLPTSLTPLVIFTDKFVLVAYANGGAWEQWTYLGLDKNNEKKVVDSPIVTVEDLHYIVTNSSDAEIASGTLEFAFIPSENGSYYMINSGYGTVADDSISIYTVAYGGSNYGVTYGTLETQVTKFRISDSTYVPSYSAELTYYPNNEQDSSQIYSKTTDNLQFVIIPVDATFNAKWDTPALTLVYTIPIFVLIGVLGAVIVSKKY